MAAKEDLAFIAQRIRKFVDSEPKDADFLAAVWRRVREAMELGACAGVQFSDFKKFFDSQRESETYDTRRDIFGRQVAAPAPISRLPLTMLEAIKWLAENGTDIGLSIPASLPNLGKFESVKMGGVGAGPGGVMFHIRPPDRDALRPHVEFLAMLVEGKRLSPRRKPPKGKAGRPPTQGTKKERKLELYNEWQTAKAAGITMKEFCADEDNRKRGITEKQINNAVDFVYRRRKRGQL